MKRFCCLVMLLVPLTGCALCEDIADFSQREWHKYTDDTGAPCNAPAARACGGDPIIQVQTVEPPR
jgi:hypothetical protein